MFAAALSLWLASSAPPKPPVPVYTIPRGEVPRDVSSAPKITTPVPQVRPKG